LGRRLSSRARRWWWKKECTIGERCPKIAAEKVARRRQPFLWANILASEGQANSFFCHNFLSLTTFECKNKGLLRRQATRFKIVSIVTFARQSALRLHFCAKRGPTFSARRSERAEEPGSSILVTEKTILTKHLHKQADQNCSDWKSESHSR
jgi:hypothetical protein